MYGFVPVNKALFVNLDHVRTIQVGEVPTQTDKGKTETMLVLNTDKQSVIVRGNFALFVLKVIGAEAHIT